MTDERYNEIDAMSEEQLDQLSDEEYKEFNSKRYMKITSQKDALEDLMAHVRDAQDGYLTVWATGFQELDKKLDGGFLGGNLIILGAISSLGKTTFALQIADQMAWRGKDVLIFSLEMSKLDLNAKSISRNTFKLVEAGWDNSMDPEKYDYLKPEYRLDMSDVLRGNVGSFGSNRRKLFEDAFKATERLKDHIYIVRDNNMNLDRIANTIQAHEDALGSARKPFVIIDYLQILKARAGSSASDKRLLTDEDVNGLKDLAVKKDVPILLISSFNRNSYLDPVSMGSYKESGTIEYSADTLIGLQYSGMQYTKHWYTKKTGAKKLVYESKQDHDTRVRMLSEEMDKKGTDGDFLPIDVVILKNRSVSKGKILFEFCPKYNIFREKQNQNGYEYEWDNTADEYEDDEDDNKTGGNKGSKKTKRDFGFKAATDVAL